MAEATAMTPANEKVPSVYHDAPSEPYHSGDNKSPNYHPGSDGIAAPQYEGPSTGTATAAHSSTDEKAKHPLVDTKSPITDAQQEVTSPATIASQSPTAQEAEAAPKTAHERAATAESNMSAAAKNKLNKNERKHSFRRQPEGR
jgi:hypothetical protein